MTQLCRVKKQLNRQAPVFFFSIKMNFSVETRHMLGIPRTSFLYYEIINDIKISINVHTVIIKLSLILWQEGTDTEHYYQFFLHI